MSIELHKRITREFDLYMLRKASKTRFKNFKKKFEKIRLREEFNKKVDEKVAEGMSPIQATFDVNYRDTVSELYNSKNKLIDKVKKNDNWTGASISFPL